MSSQNNNFNQQIEEFNALIASVDMATFSTRDQLAIASAYVDLIEKVRPIYIRQLAKQGSSETFLFKL